MNSSAPIAIGSKLGVAATKKLPGEGFKRPWPPLIKVDEAVKAKVEKLFNLVRPLGRKMKDFVASMKGAASIWKCP